MKYSVKPLFSSTIGKKLLMAISGLFLCTFLVVHLIGNLQLFKNDGGFAFNVYSKFMTTNPLIKTVAYVNYALILLHVFTSLALTIKNKKARPVSYGYNNAKSNSIWSSRNMGILGTIILVFIVVHMQNFWYEMKFGNVPMMSYFEYI
ncbi:MAG: succinate dehydrogenase, partial [Bacteroidota bacterium]